MSDKTSPPIILKIKLHAKRMKKSHPDLTHAQRLDVAARELMGIKNFNEARQRLYLQVRNNYRKFPTIFKELHTMEIRVFNKVTKETRKFSSMERLTAAPIFDIPTLMEIEREVVINVNEWENEFFTVYRYDEPDYYERCTEGRSKVVNSDALYDLYKVLLASVKTSKKKTELMANIDLTEVRLDQLIEFVKSNI